MMRDIDNEPIVDGNALDLRVRALTTAIDAAVATVNESDIGLVLVALKRAQCMRLVVCSTEMRLFYGVEAMKALSAVVMPLLMEQAAFIATEPEGSVQ